MNSPTESVMVNPAMMLPFVVLLAAIALAPFYFADWWGRNYPKVVYALAGLVIAYYFGVLREPARVWNTAHEYISFIALIVSIFVVSGGIHINVKGEATPMVNVLFLFFGALLANVFGTTGA